MAVLSPCLQLVQAATEADAAAAPEKFNAVSAYLLSLGPSKVDAEVRAACDPDPVGVSFAVR
jgi:hypothetical protein